MKKDYFLKTLAAEEKLWNATLGYNFNCFSYTLMIVPSRMWKEETTERFQNIDGFNELQSRPKYMVKS